MDERLFARLAARLQRGPVVLASVLDTRGATPRKTGSRMLVDSDGSEFSIGGGAAEAGVLDAAQALLRGRGTHARIAIDLSGGAGARGVCGGRMQLALRRWHGADDARRAAAIAAQLARGDEAWLSSDELGEAGTSPQRLRPDPRLLVVGAGHCGAALYDLARHLDFDIWVFDQRERCFADGAYATATRRCGDPAQLADAFGSAREVHAVLLNRDFPTDVATLRVLAGRALAFLGMMGSRRRIAEVLGALDPAARADVEPRLQAPVGLDIGAHTPHEIAVSILAQLIRARSGQR